MRSLLYPPRERFLWLVGAFLTGRRTDTAFSQRVGGTSVLEYKYSFWSTRTTRYRRVLRALEYTENSCIVLEYSEYSINAPSCYYLL